MRVTGWCMVFAVLMAAMCGSAFALSIQQAKMLPDGSEVSFRLAVTYAEEDFFYVQERQGISGIRVESPGHGLSAGDPAVVPGNYPDATVVQTNTNGERYVHCAYAYINTSTHPDDIEPVALTCKSIVGGDMQYDPATGAGQMGLPGASGLNNVGLYIRVCGQFTPIDDSNFILDDGSGVEVKCKCAPGLTIDPAWENITVTGVVSMYRDSETDEIRPMLYLSGAIGNSPNEVVPAPGAPVGDMNPGKDEEAVYITSGSVSFQRKQLEYSFNWGDGTSSPWSTSKEAQHAWSTPGPKSVKVTARSKAEPSIMATSEAVTVNVAEAGVEWIQTSMITPSHIRWIKCTDSGETYFESDELLVYKTKDRGLTWLPTDDRPYDVKAPNGTLFRYESNGLLRSLDAGLTWQVVYSVPSTQIESIAASPSGVIVIGTGRAIYRSADNGDHWAQVLTLGGPCVSIACGQSGVMYAATSYDKGIYKSTDDGETWTLINNGLPSTNVYTGVLLCPNGTLFTTISGDGVYRSTNGGASWSACNTGIPFSTYGATARSFAFDSSGNVYAGIACATHGIYKTSNNGDSWEAVITGSAGKVVVDDMDTIYAGMGNKIYTSIDHGSTWVEGKYASGIVRNIAAAPSGTIFTGGVRSTDKGATWESLTQSVYAAAFEFHGTTVFVGNESIYSSIDDGASWTLYTSSLPTYDGSRAVRGIKQLSNGDVIAIVTFSGYYYSKYYLCRSTDNGASWSVVIDVPSSQGLSQPVVTSSGRILIGEYDGIYASDDNGATWSRTSIPMPTTNSLYVPQIHPNGDIFVQVHAGDHVYYKSSDNGASWSQVNLQHWPTVFGPNGEYYAYEHGAVYRSRDNGATWVDLNKGLIHVGLNGMTIDPDGYIYLATEGAGIYRTKTPVQ